MANEWIMRLDEYRQPLAAESAATMRTAFMICAPAGMPAMLSTLTKGDSVAESPDWAVAVHGWSAMTMNIAKT